MNKRFFWFIGFLIVGIISCWATASSFHLMMPGMPIIAVWGMTIVFFVLASYAVKLMIDAANNDGSLNHPKLQLWGGLVLLIFTWIIISLPTNAHTFFYKLKIGDVVTEDLKSTKQYSIQIADRVNVSQTYLQLEEYVLDEWSKFSQEVISGNQSGFTGIGPIALQHLNNINTKLGAGYQIPLPTLTHGAGTVQLTDTLNKWKQKYVQPTLEKIKSDKYQVSTSACRDAKRDVRNIEIMADSIHQLVQTGVMSSSEAEPIIKQTEGVLVVAYSNIKNNQDFVVFQDNDSTLYCADPVETKTTRFLNPYSVAYDFFSGKIPFSFIFWLLLSILIDVAGFFFFEKATEKEYDF